MTERRDPIIRVIERSSLGAPAVKKLRRRTPDAVRDRIVHDARDSGGVTTKSSRQPRIIQETTMPANNRRHVVPDSNGGWRIVKPGAERASATAATQRDAELRAKEIVQRAGGGEVVIHRPDGSIRDSDTVAPGNDPLPPRDTKH